MPDINYAGGSPSTPRLLRHPHLTADCDETGEREAGRSPGPLRDVHNGNSRCNDFSLPGAAYLNANQEFFRRRDQLKYP
jgi:hypothetical protein